MIMNNEGLTKTYNRFHNPDDHDPDIAKLRQLHAAMDRAVLAAYGWTDIPAQCEFLLDYRDQRGRVEPTEERSRTATAGPNAVRDDVLGRLLALNAERAEEERRR